MATAKTRHAHKNNHHDLHRDINQIKTALSRGANHAKGKAGDILMNYYDDVRDRSSEVQENVREYVSEKPIKSLGIAVLAGMAIGYFLNRQ